MINIEEHSISAGSRGEKLHHESPSALREGLVKDFPEITLLCSDAYLAAVLGVPNRTFEYARDEKIRKALAWRRSFGVDALRSRFRYDMEEGVLKLIPADESGSANPFEPSPALLRLAKSRALRILPERGQDGRVVVLAETQLVKWREVTTEAFLQHHVLVLEAAFDLIRSTPGASPECITLLVDASGPLQAPPIAALQGMATLLQRAYPDRIHKICVGPVNFVVRSLYHVVMHLLSKTSRDKITLVGVRPTLASLGPRSPSGATFASSSTANQVGPPEAKMRPDSELSMQSPPGMRGSDAELKVDPPQYCLLGVVRRSTKIDHGGKPEQVLSTEEVRTPLFGREDKSRSRFFTCEESDVMQFQSATVRVEPARSPFSFIFSCCYQRSDDSELEIITDNARFR
mmetsp:Transcript_66045/g.214836  ORF Transcript_66045/g.214836 Transcript_66045/m.214836 type:complete len:403 (-) Transcript_66045:166-1374(-)|eukprot:CAMPEP_0203855438 /NCGR_PEP_ID=MMETSP0359-20131031/9628_1 /ASSEMBLY_ACC=CAM_ASM_000338 /TAXON_ID=268821 /ORGANISM="Scrippsiella Hangoei, Strain SHTV-5" /LENGTH=402 /DNA_ID=CAMNT_0050771985 /DNA_START=51 /DNA_END=1259 /DNA_ORIENTATION=-